VKSPNGTLLAAAALAFAALAPSTPARADNLITDGAASLGDEAFEVRLEAREAFGTPRVRTSPGFVRVWFPAMTPLSLDLGGGGEAVRFVRVRPGYDDTEVVIIRLAGMRHLPESAIDVTRDGGVARIRIARGALGLAPPGPPEPAAAEAPAAAAEPEVADADADAADADAAAAAEGAEGATGEAAAASGPALALAQRRGDAAPLPADGGPSTTIVLVLVTVLLGGAYLAVRMLRQRGKLGAPRPDIDVVTRRRLGTRHQLVVIRALGQDHLLAVQAGRTDLIASAPAPEGADDGASSDETDPLPFLRLGGPGGGEGPRVLQRDRRPPARGAESRPRFGAELMRLVGERAAADEVSLSSKAAPSEAVAGLLRLREKLGR
jgi:flagellar biogenesis protein FliO